MKLTTFILLSACLTATAAGHTQGISISGNGADLKTVLKDIEKQSGYQVFFNERLLKQAKKVNVNLKNASLAEALDACFKDQPLSYVIIDRTIVVKKKEDKNPNEGEGHSGPDSYRDDPESFSQGPPPIDIHGRILNEKGEPVAASIVIKGTNKGTTTNDNGEFELKGVDDNATLVISGVSIETFEVKVNGRSELALNAKIKTTQGEEVIVEANTGYQRVKPNEVTGSLVVIDNKKLNEQTSPNILKRLEGITPGLIFDYNKRTGNGAPRGNGITIRGLSTINASMEPLIVLDGFIYEGSIDNINPNDVETVTVLKDAAATSIWGARAGNGVIVITTKRGQFNQKLQVGFSSNVIIGEKPDLHYLPQMSSSDYIDFEQFLTNTGNYDWAVSYPQYATLTPAIWVDVYRRAGLISAADSATQINALKAIDSRDQYLKYLYVNPVTQRHALSLKGGSNNNAYTLSMGYDKSRSELQSQFDKLNIKAENLFKPVKNMLVTLSIYYTNSKNKSGAQPYGTTTIGGRYVPYYRVADDNGNALPIDIAYTGAYTDTVLNGRMLDWKYYPLEDWKHDRTTTSTQEIYAQVGLQYKLTKFLSADLKYQYQKQDLQINRFADLQSYNARDIINTFSQYDPNTDIISYIVPVGGIKSINSSFGRSYTLRGQLNFNNSWGYHNVNAIAGWETRQIRGEGNSFTEYGYKEDPLTYSAVDFVHSYPHFLYGYSQFIPGAPAFSENVYRYVSFYGNASYTFKHRYILSASARKDGSNIFGANTNDKWKPLWSAGAGWNISEEPFYKSNLFPSLKLRATYGYNGNVDPTKSALPVGTYSGNADFTNFPFVRINVLNNPDLRWEKTGMLNLGIDFSMSRGILNGSIEYYRKKATDLYGPSLYDYTVWGTSNVVTINSANLKGKGVDLVLNSKNIDRDFKWNTTFLFNYNTNRVTKYYGTTASSVTSQIGSGTNVIPVIGRPLYGIAAYKWGGLDASGNPQGYVNGQKSIDYLAIATEGQTKGVDGNITYVGPSSPSFFGSLTNSLSWKEFTLSGLIIYKLGYYFKKAPLSYQSLIDFGIGNADYSERWQKPGDEAITNVPSFLYPINTNEKRRDDFYNNAQVNVLRADNIRLQYVNLSYTLASEQIKGLPFRELDIYVNAANLGILWRSNNKGIDPDYPTTVPPSKAWTFGLRGNF